MALSRQQAFQRLRGPCVALSSVALQFRTHQSSIKAVSQALDDVLTTLQQLGDANALDEKLAEYAFFPLTHILNEAQRLSSRCLELAVESLIILVSRGWRQHLASEMGKQLLILVTLIAGADPKKQLEAPSEELKTAAFRCMDVVIKQLTIRADRCRLFDSVGTKTIVDQLAYLLLESVTEEPSDQVQLAAAKALLTLVSVISNRMLLASLLPRTASSLTQSLRASTKARRTRKVLISYLRILILILREVLADDVVYSSNPPDEILRKNEDISSEVLDESWLRATASQVNLVIVQVVKLGSHEDADVRKAVADLCFMVVSNCAKSLSESLVVAVGTITFTAQHEGGATLASRLEKEAASNPEIMRILMTKLHDWIQSLPRIMQANDDKVKQAILGQIRVAIMVAAHVSPIADETLRLLAYKMVEGITASETISSPKYRPLLESQETVSIDLGLEIASRSNIFPRLVMKDPGQSQSLQQMTQLLNSLRRNGLSDQVARLLVDRIPDLSPQEKISGIWLALACLEKEDMEDSVFDIIYAQGGDANMSRPHLVSELYAATLPYLVEQGAIDPDAEWRLTALAIECAIMQASQLDVAYRPELLDTLYPILSLLGFGNSHVRTHAITGLNLLANACRYPSTSDMLIDNVDYLINAIGMKLNSFDISPQAPQVLLMMLRLCGARIVPYMDDLIGSVLSALDNFHGYPQLVELLFQVLKVVVEESKRQPRLVITNGLSTPNHQKTSDQSSQVSDIVSDLRRRKSRKSKNGVVDDDIVRTPQRPWTSLKPETVLDENKSPQLSASTEEQSSVPSTQGEDRKLGKSHQLLLSIARSTSPHLTSPSPRVRSILLQLLEDISPLLAQDENSFLPLINNVWSSIVPRLLDYNDDLDHAETSYNVCAAADTIAILCKGAGNFMSSRIDDIFPKLRKLFKHVQGSTQARSGGEPNGRNEKAVISLGADALSVSSLRSSRTLILAALLRLLTAVQSYVNVSADIGDEILTMLAPFSDSSVAGEMRKALKTYNADAFWLWNQLREKNRGKTVTRFA